jgi:hypothetical protein
MVVEATADEALRKLSAEQILLLDVVEHMDRAVGELVIDLAKERATRQIVVYTPIGFKSQISDAWGLGGDTWQRHRSGWTPEDFRGWTIRLKSDSFFALWSP